MLRCWHGDRDKMGKATLPQLPYPSFLMIPLHQEIHWGLVGSADYNIKKGTGPAKGMYNRISSWVPYGHDQIPSPVLKLWFPPLLPQGQSLWRSGGAENSSDPLCRKHSCWLLGAWLAVRLQLTVNSFSGWSQPLLGTRKWPSHFCLTRGSSNRPSLP